MDVRWLAAGGVLLLLTASACTADPDPAPVLSPGVSAADTPRMPSAGMSVSPTPRSSGPSPDVSCEQAVDLIAAPPSGYRVVLDAVAVPDRGTLQAEASGDGSGPTKLFAKWGLVVRTGTTVELSVDAGWAQRARIGWGTPGRPAPAVRVKACPAERDPAAWSAFAGGTWVTEAACLPIIVRVGGREARVRMPVGVACG